MGRFSMRRQVSSDELLKGKRKQGNSILYLKIFRGNNPGKIFNRFQVVLGDNFVGLVISRTRNSPWRNYPQEKISIEEDFRKNFTI